MATDFPTPVADTAPALVPEVPKKRHKFILWKWSLVATGIVVAYIIWLFAAGLYQGWHQCDGLVHQFHQELNAADYETIFQASKDSTLVTPQDHKEFVKILRGVHTKLGNATSESLTNLRVNVTTDGTLTIANFASTFEHGKAEETFTWIKSRGVLKLYRYHIESDAFLGN